MDTGSVLFSNIWHDYLNQKTKDYMKNKVFFFLSLFFLSRFIFWFCVSVDFFKEKNPSKPIRSRPWGCFFRQKIDGFKAQLNFFLSPIWRRTCPYCLGNPISLSRLEFPIWLYNSQNIKILNFYSIIKKLG